MIYICRCSTFVCSAYRSVSSLIWLTWQWCSLLLLVVDGMDDDQAILDSIKESLVSMSQHKSTRRHPHNELYTRENNKKVQIVILQIFHKIILAIRITNRVWFWAFFSACHVIIINNLLELTLPEHLFCCHDNNGNCQPCQVFVVKIEILVGLMFRATLDLNIAVLD